MKKQYITGLALISVTHIVAQQNATPYTTPLAVTTPQAVTTANAAWYRGGNLNTGLAGNANIFGTLWNSPIYTKTDNIQRQILMGTSPAGSITGAFGLGTISPQSFMHLSNFDNSLTSSGSGKLFLTDGRFSKNNFVSIQR